MYFFVCTLETLLSMWYHTQTNTNIAVLGIPWREVNPQLQAWGSTWPTKEREREGLPWRSPRAHLGSWRHSLCVCADGVPDQGHARLGLGRPRNAYLQQETVRSFLKFVMNDKWTSRSHSVSPYRTRQYPMTSCVLSAVRRRITTNAISHGHGYVIQREEQELIPKYMSIYVIVQLDNAVYCLPRRYVQSMCETSELGTKISRLR